MENLNLLHVIVAALVAFGLGSVWFSKLMFLKPWMAAIGVTEEDAKNNTSNMGFTLGVAFVLAVITSMCISFIVGNHGAMDGFWLGAGAGAGIAATQIGTHYLFEQRTLTHFLITAGYSVVSCGLMGLIHGAWH